MRPGDLGEAGEAGEAAGEERGLAAARALTGMPAKAAACAVLADRAHLEARGWSGSSPAQVTSAATRPRTKPQCRRRPVTMRGRRASGTSAGDCGQPSESGSLSGPSSSIETKSSMMKLRSSVVTTSSTPKRTLRSAGPRRSSAAGGDRGEGDQRQEERRRAAARAPVPSSDGDQRAGVELRLGADVPEPGAEGDGDGEAGEDQRRGAVQRLEERRTASRRRP